MLHGSSSVLENLDLFLPFVHFKGLSCSTLDLRMVLSGKRGACYLHFTNVEAEVWRGDIVSLLLEPGQAWVQGEVGLGRAPLGRGWVGLGCQASPGAGGSLSAAKPPV